VAARPATVSDDDGNVITVASVPARVSELLTVSVFPSTPARVMELLAVNVLPSAMVKVDPVAGAVNVTLLTEVAVATPIVGVVSVGEVAKTMLPEPVVVLPNAVTVPLVGNVSDVVPLTVKVVPKAPLIVIVLAALFATPVPP